MEKTYLKTLAIVFVLTLVISLCGCVPTPYPYIKNTDAEIDLSRFTPVEMPELEYPIKDWMIPKHGVITSFDTSTGAVRNIDITISGITLAQVENYKNVLLDNGMIGESTSIPDFASYKKPYGNYNNLIIRLDTKDVETTKSSSMNIRITVPMTIIDNKPPVDDLQNDESPIIESQNDGPPIMGE